jgi:hypothetical protein
MWLRDIKWSRDDGISQQARGHAAIRAIASPKMRAKRKRRLPLGASRVSFMSCGAGANGENFDVGSCVFFSSVTLLTGGSLEGEGVAEPWNDPLGPVRSLCSSGQC